MQSFYTKRDAIAEQLRQEIFDGTLPPGTQLLQNDVAARLDVSSTPVREAFRALEAEGLIESRPHRGVVVAEDEDDFLATYELRTLVEVAALRRAKLPLEPKVLSRLKTLVAESRVALQAMDRAATRKANPEFHATVASLSGSRAFTDHARSLIWRSRSRIPLDRRRMKEVLNLHEAILRNLEKGDLDAAVKALAADLEMSLKSIASAREPRALAEPAVSPTATVRKRKTG